jgi:hypothetical protein
MKTLRLEKKSLYNITLKRQRCNTAAHYACALKVSSFCVIQVRIVSYFYRQEEYKQTLFENPTATW